MSTDIEPDGPDDSVMNRKSFLRTAALALPIPALVSGGAVAHAATQRASAGGLDPAVEQITELEPTPFCDDGDDPTPEQTEGPYFKPNSPLRTSLVDASTPGTRLTVSGYVFGLGCQTLSGVLLDFWQADVNGAYDNVGFRFRGHQFTDSRGAFALSTIVPGLYPGRTRHIHVKLQFPNHPVVTTQLYFPNEPRNRTDSIFDPRLVMNVRQDGSGRQGTFDFVLAVQGTPTPTPTPTATSTQTPTPTPTPTSTSTGGTSWHEYATYAVGDVVTYDGVSYRCIQAHTAYPGWLPPVVPALWGRL